MDTPVRVNVTPTFTDYFLLNLRVSIRRMRFLIVLIPFAIFSLIGYALIPTLDIPEENAKPFGIYVTALPLLVLPGTLFGFLPASIYLAAWNRWRQANELREPRTYIFSGAGIQVIASSFEGTNSWLNIASVERAGSIVYLTTTQKAFYLIPVRAFESELELERFSNLVEQKVSKTRMF